jgi:hypothetical protein
MFATAVTSSTSAAVVVAIIATLPIALFVTVSSGRVLLRPEKKIEFKAKT